MGDQASSRDFIGEVQCQRAFFQQVIEKGHKILAVHLARVGGHFGGQVRMPDNRHSGVDHVLIRLGEFAVPTLLRGQVNDHRSGPHVAHGIRFDQERGGLAGHQRCRNHQVRSGHVLAEFRPLALIEFLGLGLGVAAGILGVTRVQIEFHKACPNALHLLANHRPGVVSVGDRAQSFGRAQGLKPGDTDPHHQHSSGLQRPGRSHQHGENPREDVGPHQNRLVARNRALTRERIHGLSPGDPGHQFHRKGGDSAIHQALGDLGLIQGLEKTHQRRTLGQLVHFVTVGRLTRHLHLQDQICPQRFAGPLDNPGPRRHVGVVFESRRGTGARFHHNLGA